MKSLLRKLILPVALLFLSSAHAESPSPIEAHVTFTYENFKPRAEIYELKPAAQYDIAETKTFQDISRSPLLHRVSNVLPILPGRGKTFAMVVKNESSKTVFFYATPHQIQPPEAAVGYVFRCLCIHSVYKIPPKSTWYRIFRLEFDESVKFKKVELGHTLFGVTKKQLDTTFKSMMYDQGTL